MIGRFASIKGESGCGVILKDLGEEVDLLTNQGTIKVRKDLLILLADYGHCFQDVGDNNFLPITEVPEEDRSTAKLFVKSEFQVVMYPPIALIKHLRDQGFQEVIGEDRKTSWVLGEVLITQDILAHSGKILSPEEIEWPGSEYISSQVIEMHGVNL